MSTADVDAWLDRTNNPKQDVIVESVQAARDDLVDIVDLWCSTR